MKIVVVFFFLLWFFFFTLKFWTSLKFFIQLVIFKIAFFWEDLQKAFIDQKRINFKAFPKIFRLFPWKVFSWQLFILLLKIKLLAQECEVSMKKNHTYEYTGHTFSNRRHWKTIQPWSRWRAAVRCLQNHPLARVNQPSASRHWASAPGSHHPGDSLLISLQFIDVLLVSGSQNWSW